MSLASGTVLGPYSIVAPLGAGGMGEVYRARDAKLHRDVAIKVLPAAVAADADRLARFEREAQVLAALNHPNIASIYGLVEDHGVTALVLELVEGATLADRLAHGPMPIDEALPIARQIAEALETAHEAGIVHRDLKPANIKLRADGTAKVLDFGLAKALDTGPNHSSSTDLTNSPTLAARGTEAGIILGTAAYMSPEQARGKRVDKRADIWAFGVVLWETLAGERLFEGETISDTIASVLTKPVDAARLPASIPAAVRQLVSRCLERDPARRLRDIGEARLVLADPGSAVSPSPARAPASSRHLAAFTAAAALAGAVVVGTAWAFWPVPSVSQPVTVFQVTSPAGLPLSLVNRPAVSVSQDGGTLVFVARRDGIPRLFVKRRGDPAPVELPGTEGGNGPTVSPDGRRIAFVANARLRLVNADGGAVTEVMAVSDERGHVWRDNARLIVSPQPVSPLVEVQASGGSVRSVTKLEAGERSHRWPALLRDGKTVVFTVGRYENPDDYDDCAIEAVDLDTGVRSRLLTGARMALSGPPGLLLTVRSGILSAMPFDEARRQATGPPVAVVQGVYGDKTTGASHVSYAADGTLVYVPGDPQGTRRRLVWTDAKGVTTTVITAEGGRLALDPSLAPDGRRLALVLGAGGSNDVWIHDFSRQAQTRFTFGGNNATPVWSADGRTIYYSTIDPTGLKSTISRKPADGSRQAETLFTLEGRIYLKMVDEARGELLVDLLRQLNQADVFRITFGHGEPRLQPLVSTTFDEVGGSLSPDRRWVAYASDESGRYEIYVTDVSSVGGGRWQVSNTGGEEPRWSPDGRRLYFRSDARFMAADVSGSSSFEASSPVMLFDGIYEMRTDSAVTYSVDTGGQRFLMLRPEEDTFKGEVFRVLLNWGSSLRKDGGSGYNPASP